MLSKSSFFTTILLLLPALASAQTADDDLQLELRYYAPKLKFTSHGIVPAAYSNFRDTLNIKNGNAPEYRLSGKNWYVDYIAIHEKGYASHHIPAQGSLIPADSRTKLNLDYASFHAVFASSITLGVRSKSRKSCCQEDIFSLAFTPKSDYNEYSE